MTEAEQRIFDVLTQYSEIFTLDNVVLTPLRWIGWLVIKGFIIVMDSLQTVVMDTLDLMTLHELPEVQELVRIFVPAAYGIGILSIIIFSFRKILNPQLPGFNLFDNLLKGTAALTLGGLLIGQLLTMSTDVARALYTQNSFDSSMALRIVNENGYDLRKYMLDGFKTDDKGHLSANLNLTKNNMAYFDYPEGITVSDANKAEKYDKHQIAEKVKVDFPEEYEEMKKRPENRNPHTHQVSMDLLENNIYEKYKDHYTSSGEDNMVFDKELFNYRLIIDTEGNPALKKVTDYNWLGIEQKYYRFKLNFWTILLMIATSCFALLISAIKIVKLQYEIIFTQTLLPLLAFEDLSRGARLKKAIEGIKNSMLVIILSALIINTYFVIAPVINSKISSPFSRIIIQFALLLTVIDGPNIVQQLTGIDGGLKSTAEGMVGVMLGSKAAVNAISPLAKAVTNLPRAIKNGYEKVKEMSDRIMGGQNNSAEIGKNSQSETNSRDQYVQTQLKAYGIKQTESSDGMEKPSSTTQTTENPKQHSTTSQSGSMSSENPKTNSAQNELSSTTSKPNSGVPLDNVKQNSTPPVNSSNPSVTIPKTNSAAPLDGTKSSSTATGDNNKSNTTSSTSHQHRVMNQLDTNNKNQPNKMI